MKKLRILFECPSYLPVRGGIQIGTHITAKELIRRGHDVSVLCEQTDLKFKEYEIIDKVKVYRFPKASLPKAFKSLTFVHKQAKIKKYLKSFLEKNELDVVISRFPFYVSPTKSIRDIPLIYYQPSIVHIALEKSASNIVGLLNKFNQHIRSMNAYSIEKKAVKLADRTLARGKAMVQVDIEDLKAEKKKIGILTHGICTNDFKSRKKDKSLIKKYNLKNKKVVLTVSRLTPDKNNVGLLRAFSNVKDKESILLIVGGGKEEKDLRKLASKLDIEDRVVFAGNQDDVRKFYNLGDVFVLASEQEGFGIVFLEALASGLPIIGYKAEKGRVMTAVEDIIGNKKIGFAVKNEKDMANKIDLLLKDKKLLSKMKVNAKKRAKDFSWKDLVDNLLKEIDKVINK